MKKNIRLQKILVYAIAAFILVYLSFILPKLLPGDYTTAMYGNSQVILNSEDEALLKSRYSSDEGFFQYMRNICRFDLGQSYAFQVSVTDLILDSFPWTVLLVLSSQILSTIIGFILGVESAWLQGSSQDKRLVGAMTIFEGIPDIALAIILLIVFCYKLEIFPAGGAETSYALFSSGERTIDMMHHLALPLLTLVISYIPGNFLLVRNSMVMILGEKYMTTAQAKGLTAVRIRYRHGARNALLPLATRVSMRLAFIITGAIIIETIFSYPGIGTMLYNAIEVRDVPVIRGIILVLSLIVLTINTGLDYLYSILDPRVGHEK